MTKNETKLLMTVAAVGTAMTFLGHGMWAATGLNPKFPALLTGSLDNVLGITISNETAVSWVKFIGYADIVMAAVIALGLIGLFVSSGTLKRLATSNLLLAIYIWGVFWGFMTAASRVTAAGEFYPEIWDWVERAPNFTIPLVGVIIILHLRKPIKKGRS